MFKPADKTELNQISLTGMRAIVLIGLLIEAPRTLEEIREKFIGFNIMEPEHSDDILRIDLNTLRIMGCDITKANIKTGYKYTLLNHPFSLTITDEEFNVIKKAYKWIKESANIELILEYHELFNKLAEHISDSETREEVEQILNNVKIDTPSGFRNRVILELLWATGMRVSELSNLNFGDLNIDENEIRVFGKGAKERIVLMSDRAKSYLVHYINSARNLLAPG